MDGAAVAAGITLPNPAATTAVLCLAGADSAADVRLLAAIHGATGLAATLVIENDSVAGLRAGSPSGGASASSWGRG